MEILSIIPARGGSKGIPLKNLVILGNKPLLYYTIKSSKESKLITRTLVSTDNEKIARYAEKNNVQVLKRPKRLANDKAGLESVIDNVLKTINKKENYIPDIIVLLQNTSPLRLAKHIDEAIKFFIKGKYDSVLSGFSSHYFFWKTVGENVKPVNYSPLQRPNRQKMKGQFVENGAIYITKYSCFKKNKCRISGEVGMYEMPREISTEIDSYNDLFLVAKILRKQK